METTYEMEFYLKRHNRLYFRTLNKKIKTSFQLSDAEGLLYNIKKGEMLKLTYTLN